MARASLLDAPDLAAAKIDERASGENFPVVSVLAPRWARPHLRALYGFARLVDNLGDEAEGDRVGAAGRARAGARRPAADRGHAPAARDDRGARPPARALPPADRGEPHRPDARPLRDLGGRARVLHVLGRPGRTSRARDLRARGRAGARGDERLGLHRPPARQLPPGPAARPLARPRLPAPGVSAPLRSRGRGARRPAHGADRGAAALRGRAGARPSGGRASRSGGRSAADRGCRSRSTRAADWPRSMLSSAPAGTSSRAVPLRPGRPSPGWRSASSPAGHERRRTPTPRSPASRAGRRGTSRGGSPSCRGRSGWRSLRSTRSLAGWTTSRTIRRSTPRHGPEGSKAAAPASRPPRRSRRRRRARRAR